MEEKEKSDFIRDIINEDLKMSKNQGRVHTRFPPEPNGYLHIGHAKSIVLNSGIAKDYNGKFNLRFDDTNPSKEEQEYVDAIIEDVHWLGGNFEDRLFYASDYFEQMYRFAVTLIQKGKAFVCDLNADQMRQTRGTLTEPGTESPFRNRAIEVNLDLFERMRSGEFPNGAKTLRAKIDMSSPNINLRDPVMYRIVHDEHHRQGKAWCIYPTYDWAHGIEDSIEGITHSICTLEFENHRPLYDWYLNELGVFHPRQIEFARLNVSYTVLSKRKLLKLVDERHVSGWNDPRMPTIAGLRRRGYTAQSIKNFCDMIGVAKRDSTIDVSLLEYSIREDLNKHSRRTMAVLHPLKIVITNYPENQTELCEAVNNPEDPSAGSREITFSRELFIDQDDFKEIPPPKYYRLSPGTEVRLKYAYIIKCVSVKKDDQGNVVEVHCTYDPESKSGMAGANRKVKATLHWVSAEHSKDVVVRLYDRLFVNENPDDAEEGKDFLSNLNPNSLQVVTQCKVETMLAEAKAGETFQFERTGYFTVDPWESGSGKPVFNRVVTLKDTWAKIERKDHAKGKS